MIFTQTSFKKLYKRPYKGLYSYKGFVLIKEPIHNNNKIIQNYTNLLNNPIKPYVKAYYLYI